MYNTLMGAIIDRAINFLKWPMALLAIAVLPAGIQAFIGLVRRCLQNPQPVQSFLIGAAIWLLLWWSFLRRTRYQLLLTLEHELTHVLFAWLTMHRVTRFRVTVARGGQVVIHGQGNWLITISPYFWPTACLIVMLVTWLSGTANSRLGSAVLGGSFAWHLTATIRELHPRQTDLQRVGPLFATMFLPSANIVMLGIILSSALDGAIGSLQFLRSIAAAARFW